MGLLSDDKIPIGLGMALAQNMQAMQVFSSMSSTQQEEVIERTHEINSSAEMKAFVNHLSDYTSFKS